MRDFAVIDDSVVYENGIYSYSHALIVNPHQPALLTFSGTKDYVYSQEDGILQFIMSHMDEGCKLFACEHYKMYPTIWDEVFSEVNGVRLPKLVKKTFTEAHHAAKSAAQDKLLEMLIEQEEQHG
ncbi:hypothetical protein ACFL3V_02380 [Nanoarchaeota archaeon]